MFAIFLQVRSAEYKAKSYGVQPKKFYEPTLIYPRPQTAAIKRKACFKDYSFLTLPFHFIAPLAKRG